MLLQIFLIAKYTFALQNDLWRVSLQSNVITVIEKHAFYGLELLKLLHLRNNRIRVIYLGDLPTGIMVDLQQNDIHDYARVQDLEGSNDMYYMHIITNGKHTPNLLQMD